jgi:hypothetical protein
MTRHIALLVVLAASASAGTAAASSWIFQPSYYSHSPETGQRVVQYQPEQPAIAPFDPTYQESGYRQSTASIRVGNSSDHIHVVQTWGQGENIRPYGEWLFPYRAGATPYGPWGNPQGPWTLPFDSWQNPFALGQMQQGPWGYGMGQGWPGQGPAGQRGPGAGWSGNGRGHGGPPSSGHGM